MLQDVPFFRETGTGPGVVCIHSNASTSSQWRALTERMSPRFRVLAADSIGAGKSPPWPANRTVTLSDEVALLEPVFAAAGHPFFLVGHSYGAAVALIAALSFPERVRAMVLYEPTLFAVLEQEAPGQPSANGIRSAADDAARSIRANDPMAAGERFIDYWMGDGTWKSMPGTRQAQIAGSMRNIAGWADALFTEPTLLRDFAALDMPILYMLGARSPASTHGVARLLTSVLPSVTVMEFTDLGHMGPVTHPDVVNEAVEAFLQRN
ncbi:MAG: alpha/beta hydrolase [Variovorax sp.]|nr:alpha/beta hydrolase [Variovorax sp.]